MIGEVQEKIIVEEEKMESVAEPLPLKKAPRKKRINIPKKGERFKLIKFDFILLQLIKEGKADPLELLSIFNVGEEEFRGRMDCLKEAGYISVNADSSKISLSIKGVNDYSIKWKRFADDWLGRKEKKIREKPDIDAENKKLQSQTQQFAFAHSIQAKLPVELLWKEIEQRHVQIQELPEDKRNEATVDIMELIRDYGPTEEQKKTLNKTSPFVERHMKPNGAKKDEAKKETQTVPAPSLETKKSEVAEKPYYNRAISDLSKQAAEIESKGDTCELCKSGFMISVKEEEHNPKFGHCFCGAPYHKDCYEGIMEGDGKCIKCGRKLGSGSDFKVEDAFKAIRDISY
jgi:hypothetical protein